MTDANRIIEAIAKASPDTAAVFYRDIGLQLGEQGAREMKEWLLDFMPAYYASSVDALRRSAGRGYVESVSKSAEPDFDPMIMAALEHAVEGYVLFSKSLTQDWFTVNGNRVDVYRDESGRFASKGSAPKNDRGSDIGEYYAPGTSGKKVKPSRVLPKEYKDLISSGSGGRAEYKGEEGKHPTKDRTVTYGIQSMMESEKFTDAMSAMGVDPGALGNRVSVTATMVNLDGREEQVPMAFDGKRGVYAPINSRYNRGWATTEIVATPTDPGDTEVAEMLHQNRQYTHTFAGADSIAQASAAYAGAMGGNVDVNRMQSAERKLSAGGKLLNTLGMNVTGEKMQTAGRVVGALDNEDVRHAVGRTAARYRGVEAPAVDTRLQQAAISDFNADPEFGANEDRINYYKQTQPGEPVSTEALRMGQTRDKLSVVMQDRLARRSSSAGLGTDMATNAVNYNNLAQRIARGIGRGMPSEGVMLDRNGKIVSQSMGVASDHFTPFSAEALGKMNGGQYVRSRQLGGLTTEDLRTLILGNGRAAQVVSASGVYELELDPSLRGGKRYNDKTLQIIDTYERILDEVANGGQYVVPLPPTNEAEAKKIAAQKSGGNAAKYDQALRVARHEQYNKLAALPAADEQRVRAQAESQARAEFAEKHGKRVGYGRDSADRWLSDDLMRKQEAFAQAKGQQAVEDATNERSRMLSLNSEGYALALNMLKQYYPYVVRTARYRSNDELKAQVMGGTFQSGSTRPGPADQWHTPKGQLRPTFSDVSGGVGEDGKELQGREAANARAGLPVNRAERRNYVMQGDGAFSRIRPGMAVNVGIMGGGAASTGSTAGAQVASNRASAAKQRLQQDIGSVKLNTDDDAGSSIDFAYMNKLNSNTDKSRVAMMLFNSQPDKTVEFLQKNPAVMDALVAPGTVGQIAAKTGADPGAVARIASGIDLVMATAAPSASVDARAVTDVNDLPAYDGKMVRADAGVVEPREFDAIVERSPLLKSSATFAAAVLQTGLDDAIPMSKWTSAVDAVDKVTKAVATGGVDLSGANDEAAVLQKLQGTGMIDSQTAAMAGRFVTAWRQTGNTDPGLFEAGGVQEQAKRSLALGVGIAVDRALAGGGEAPKATAPKGPFDKALGLTEVQRWIVDMDLPLRL